MTRARRLVRYQTRPGQALVFVALVLTFLSMLVLTCIEVAARYQELAQLEDALKQATRSSVQAFDYSAFAQNGQKVRETSATITWTVDRNVTGQIEYGLTAGYGSSTTAETSLNFSQHSQTITDLEPNTTYHYHAIGQDASAQSYDSGDLTFTTASTAASTDYPTTANPMVFQSLISASERSSQ